MTVYYLFHHCQPQYETILNQQSANIESLIIIVILTKHTSTHQLITHSIVYVCASHKTPVRIPLTLLFHHQSNLKNIYKFKFKLDRKFSTELRNKFAKCVFFLHLCQKLHHHLKLKQTWPRHHCKADFVRRCEHREINWKSIHWPRFPPLSHH